MSAAFIICIISLAVCSVRDGVPGIPKHIQVTPVVFIYVSHYRLSYVPVVRQHVLVTMATTVVTSFIQVYYSQVFCFYRGQ